MSLREDIEILCSDARAAAEKLALCDTEKKNEAITAIAEQLRAQKDKIIEANALDLAFAKENGIPDAMLDRLCINEERIGGICHSLYALCELEDPVGKSECWSRPSGIEISRVRVPLGVVAIIYEARPNVTVDSAACDGKERKRKG